MAHASGHVLRIERTSGPRFYAKVRHPSGRQEKQLLGRAWEQKGGKPAAGYLTRKQAEQRLQGLLTDMRRGEVPDPGRRPEATFRDAAGEYLRYAEHVRQIDPATLADYRGVVEGYLLDEFGDAPIDGITPDQIDAYKERMLAEGKLSNRTIVRHLVVLHGTFKRAQRVWGLRTNPASAEQVERPRVIYSGEFDTLDPDEVELVATLAHSEQDGAIYRLAAYSGLRQGELLALRWSCVDFVGGLLQVRRNYTGGREKVPKGKKVRSVPMVPAVIDTLAKLKGREHFTGDADLVFVNELGEHVDHFALRRRWYATLDRAGLRRLRLHDLRHAFCSMAITKLDPYAVQSYAGHQHYSTTQRYLHHQPRREDAAKLAEAFGRVPNGVPNSAISGGTERNSEHQSVPERVGRA